MESKDSSLPMESKDSHPLKDSQPCSVPELNSSSASLKSLNASSKDPTFSSQQTFKYQVTTSDKPGGFVRFNKLLDKLAKGDALAKRAFQEKMTKDFQACIDYNQDKFTCYYSGTIFARDFLPPARASFSLGSPVSSPSLSSLARQPSHLKQISSLNMPSS